MPVPRKSKRKSLPKSRKTKAGGPAFRITQRTWKRPGKKRFDKGRREAPPASVQRLAAKVRSYKVRAKSKSSLYAKTINQKLEASLEKAGYTPDYIKAAKKYRLSGRVSAIARTKVKYSGGNYRYKGKFISRKKAKQLIATFRYHETIKHYRTLYGLTLREARELWKGLRDEKFGREIFKALY